MSALGAQPPMPRAAARSRKLTTTAIILMILPLLLPFPFYGLAALWIGPAVKEQLLQCASFDCPAAIAWLRLGWFLVLGPSILVGVTSMLLGSIGLFRMRWHPTSPENEDLFQVSVIGGFVWVFFFGFILWLGITYLAILIL